MIRQPVQRRTQVILAATSVCLLVIVYAFLSYRQHQYNPKDKTIPNLSQFVEGWKELLTPADEFWLVGDVGVTYGRLFLGLAAGVTISLLVGMAMGCFGQAEAFFLPPLSFLAKIPPTAMLAVYFVVFGIGLQFYVAMVAVGIFPTLAQGIYQAAKKDVSDHAIYKAYSLGASHFEVIWNVIYRQILPRIIESVRLQIGPAMVFLIAAELALGSEGFGYTIRMKMRRTDMAYVYTYLIFLGATGFLMDSCLVWLRRWLCPWFGE
jgi:NitT/TauT family transport system permease protein